MSDKIRLAGVAPPGCASCHGQYVDRRHVDFGANYDGPTLPPDHEKVAGGKYLSIDDLVICEECLSTAAVLLDLGDTRALRAEVKELVNASVAIGERLRDAMAYIGELEAAAAGRERIAEMLRG